MSNSNFRGPRSDIATILIVDDTPVGLSVVGALFEGNGYRIAVAQDGAEALQRAQQVLPDLILLDVMLPDIDGFEVCRRLKADKKTCDIPVIFMTALTAAEDKVRGFKSGGADYFTKPLQVDEALARVATQLKLHAAQRRLTEQNAQLEQQVAERTAELAERERQFRSLAENSPDHIMRHDRDCRMLYLNPRLAAVWGAAAHDLIGKTPLEAFSNGEFADYQACVEAVIETGQPAEIEIMLPDTGSGLRYHHVRFAAEREANGEIAGVLAIGRDITERKRTADALHFVAQRGWGGDGKNFFDALAQYLGQTLGVDYVIVDKLGEAPGSAETLALFARGGIAPNISYSLVGTPCENVMGRSYCCYRQGIQQLFPRDSLLVDMGAESYAGIPLWDSTGQPLGLIAVMDGKPLEDEAAVAQLLKLVAPRAAAELERERSDGLLRVREQEFRSLAESMPDCIIRYDFDGRMLYLNSEVLRQLGLTDATDVIGKLPSEVWPDGRYADIDRAIARAMETEADASIEIVGSAPDGEPGFFEIRIIPEWDDGGKMIGTIAFGRDITELKRYQQTLLASERKYRSLAENAPDNIARYDLQGRHVYINRRLEETLGLAADDILGKTPEDFFPGSELPSILKVAETGEPFETEVALPDVGAGVLYHSLRFVAERGPQGDIVGVLGIGRDVTERKQAENERLARLHFVESLDRIDRAIQGTQDIDEMMRDVLDAVLAIFDCDRVFLLYPCDPTALGWRVPMERTKPEYPGALALGQDIPWDDGVAAKQRVVLDAVGPVQFGPGCGHPLPMEVSTRFGFKCLMSMAVRPRGDKPWEFGMMQCSHARVWTADEERLLHEIGRRLADGLTGLLAHRRVRESEMHLRTLVQTIPDLVWSKDTEGVFLGCNPRFERFLGATEADIVGKTDYDFVSPELADFFRANDRKALAAGRPSINEEWLTFAADGYRGLFETVKTPLRDDAGTLIGVLGVARDITERRKMEDALRVSEMEFRSLAENAPDIIIRYDLECRRTYVNPAYEREIDLMADTVLGLTPKDGGWRFGIPAADYMERLRLVMATGESAELHLSGTRFADGAAMHFALRVVAERNADGQVTGALAIGRNVTVLLKTEHDLEESRRQLRDLATRREAAREEERRRIARELHDELGQQLTALRFNVTLLDYQFGDEQPRIRETTANLLRLVEKTIQTTRNVSSALRPAVLDMGIIPALEWLVAESVQNGGIACELKGPLGDVRMEEDYAVVVFRIVQESLTNAIRHSKANNLQVVFTCEEDAYVIEVKDNGIGFDPDGPRKERSFGLVGIRERALAVGGKVVVFSSPGWGTVVRVRIPIVTDKEEKS